MKYKLSKTIKVAIGITTLLPSLGLANGIQWLKTTEVKALLSNHTIVATIYSSPLMGKENRYIASYYAANGEIIRKTFTANLKQTSQATGHWWVSGKHAQCQSFPALFKGKVRCGYFFKYNAGYIASLAPSARFEGVIDGRNIWLGNQLATITTKLK